MITSKYYLILNNNHYYYHHYSDTISEYSEYDQLDGADSIKSEDLKQADKQEQPDEDRTSLAPPDINSSFSKRRDVRLTIQRSISLNPTFSPASRINPIVTPPPAILSDRLALISRFPSINSDYSDGMSDEFTSLDTMYTSSEFSEYSAPPTPQSLSISSHFMLSTSIDSLFKDMSPYNGMSSLPYPRLEMCFDSAAESIRIFLAVNRQREVYIPPKIIVPGEAIRILKEYLNATFDISSC